MTNVNEIWIPAYNYQEKYEVSNLGKVRKSSTKRELVGHISKGGYRRVSLSKNSKNINISIHRLVLQSFIGDKPNLVVNHKNGIKTDNRLENLEWCTISENTQHSFDNKMQVNAKGIFSKTAKIWMHKEYGFFLSTIEIFNLYRTNPTNKKPMAHINSQYIRI